MSVRVCVLGSGSRGNSTWVATERTCVLVDAGFGEKETFARLASVGERPENMKAILISHEHVDHVNGLRRMARHLKVPVYLNGATHQAIEWNPPEVNFQIFETGTKFAVGDIEVTPFLVPHDASEPVAFTLEAEGIKIGVITDLGYVPEVVKQHARGCQVLVFESNHDLDMLKVGPYPWHVKQRVMGRHGHLSNNATADFLADDLDGSTQVLVLAHLSETNNHPEVARLSAVEALSRRNMTGQPELHLASQTAPSDLFRW